MARRSPIQFLPSEPVCAGLHRLATAQRQAAEQAGKSQKGASEAVHAARLAFKFLRAILKLTADVTGKKFAHRQNARLRHAAKALSVWRDEVVIGQTLEELAQAMPRKHCLIVKASFREWRKKVKSQQRRRRPLKVAMQNAIKCLRAFEASAECLSCPPESWPVVAARLKKSFRKACRSLRLAEASELDETYHEARKRMKELYYHLEAVRLACPSRLGSVVVCVQKVQKLLGDDHDIAIARHVILEIQPAKGEDFAEVLDMLGERTRKLRKKIHHCAGKLFRKEAKERLKAAEKRLRRWPLRTGGSATR